MPIRKVRKVVQTTKPNDRRVVCIGIDPSLIGSGIAVVASPGVLEWAHGWTDKKGLQKKHPEHLTYFKLKDSSDANRLARIELVADWLLHCIGEWSNDNYELYVAIEGYAMSRLSNRASDLHELGGTIKLALWEQRIPFRIYTPTELKAAWTGQGNADKSAMIMTCFRRFNVDYTLFESAGENLADATLLAHLLYQEVEVKAGRMQVKGCLASVRKALLKTTKAAPEALLTRPFCHQDIADIEEPVFGGN